jgi:hypothetical protein
MGWIPVTAAWAFLYLLAMWAVLALSDSFGERWQQVLPGVFLGGLAAIVCLGFFRRLPGMGPCAACSTSTGPVLTFFISLAEWSGGLGCLAGLILLAVSGTLWGRNYFKGEVISVLAVVIPSGVAFLGGAILGACVAVVKACL